MDTKDTKVSANRQKKVEIVASLSDKFNKAKAVVFTNYEGLTHKQIEALKKAIKPLEGEFVVAKNSLVTRSLDEKKLKLEDDHALEGPTGTLFIYNDIVAPLKALAKTIKELNLPSVKFGIMDKAFIGSEQVLKLSTLPTREVLLAQLVGGLKSPIVNLHRALNWNLQKLVLTLNAVASAKPAPKAPAPEPEEPQEAAPAETTQEEKPAEPTQTEEKLIEDPKGGEN
ncbi:MAG: 50S ribosomal protein L10 [Candidatus Levybacteria bacterium]|nr:50S ribosomal protein L10 [Candidatus Levybacteria bacterium]